jgi:hypothetical protein
VSKKPKPLQIQDLFRAKGFERNLAVERRSAHGNKAAITAVDAEMLRNVRENLGRKDAQRAKAARPRGATKSDDRLTMRERVAAQAKQHPEATTPAELLPHVTSSAEANGVEPISIKRLRTVLRELRKAR